VGEEREPKPGSGPSPAGLKREYTNTILASLSIGKRESAAGRRSNNCLRRKRPQGVLQQHTQTQRGITQNKAHKEHRPYDGRPGTCAASSRGPRRRLPKKRTQAPSMCTNTSKHILGSSSSHRPARRAECQRLGAPYSTLATTIGCAAGAASVGAATASSLFSLDSPNSISSSPSSSSPRNTCTAGRESTCTVGAATWAEMPLSRDCVCVCVCVFVCLCVCVRPCRSRGTVVYDTIASALVHVRGTPCAR
jgi:hypothetical protein